MLFYIIIYILKILIINSIIIYCFFIIKSMEVLQIWNNFYLSKLYKKYGKIDIFQIFLLKI